MGDIEHSSSIATFSVQDSEVCLERYIEKSIGSNLILHGLRFLSFYFLNGEMVATKIPGARGTEVILSHHVRGSDYTQHGTLVSSEGAMGGQSRERLAFEL